MSNGRSREGQTGRRANVVGRRPFGWRLE